MKTDAYTECSGVGHIHEMIGLPTTVVKPSVGAFAISSQMEGRTNDYAAY